MKNTTYAGLLLFVSGSIILMGIITAEAFYPSGYTTANSEISDLGATVRPNSVSYQPSATIFNYTMMLAGLMTAIAALLQHRWYKKHLFTIPLLLLGIGMLGVGFFPGNRDPYHGIFALLTFNMGGLMAIASFKIVSAPFSYIGIVFGLITIITLYTASFFIPIIGDGGTERWVAYPVVLWLMGLGGYMLNEKQNDENKKHMVLPKM
jgi:hypothetical membrane protein